jgi:hypothetical protein
MTTKRTKLSKDPGVQTMMSQIVGRAMLAAKLGQQYGTDRDVYEALGYKKTLDYSDFAARYYRQDIAKAIIDRPVKVTWRGELAIIESDDDKETALEKAWVELEERLQVTSRFGRLDKLTGIGQFGILFLGLSDAKNRDGHSKPVAGSPKLSYIKPFGQGSVEISKYESRTASPRYGLPTEYTIEMTSTGASDYTTEVKVHYNRVIHVTDEAMESEVKGTPRLEVVFNRLMDLEKLVGGSAEMFWRGARPGYQGKLDKDFMMTQATKDDLEDQINEYENNLRRILINEGVDLQALQQQVSEPGDHVDIQIQMISAATGIPKRILTGSERGELSSQQDKTEWLTYVKSRREEYAEPNIVRPFVDRLIEFGILPEAGKDGYIVKWEDLFAQSEKEKVDIGKIRAEALSKYAASPMAEMTIPPDEFLKYFLGLSKEEVEQITEARDAAVTEEQNRLMTPAEEELERKRLEEERLKQSEEV